MGRPTVYTPELAQAICESLADGMTLRQACREESMPPESTVRRWALENWCGFAAHYTRAREIGYHAMADELVEIADDGSNDWMEREDKDGNPGYVANGEHVTRSRLRADTRKWLLSKALPKIYGDKVALTGLDDGPIEMTVTHVKDSLSRKLDRVASTITEEGVARQLDAGRT